MRNEMSHTLNNRPSRIITIPDAANVTPKQMPEVVCEFALQLKGLSKGELLDFCKQLAIESDTRHQQN